MLVIFDIDGTLTRTYALDAELFARTFRELHGWTLDVDWSRYRHATDQGITEEALALTLGHEPTPGEIARVRRRYLELLERELAHEPARHQVPGAAAAIGELARRGHGIAFATGCWRPSADLKLGRAGIDAAGRPLASCDDHVDRIAILRLAKERAGALRPLEPVVYVGDGPWDLVAARELRVSFVGVACDGSARLASSGARHVMKDFRDIDAVLQALRDAANGPA